MLAHMFVEFRENVLLVSKPGRRRKILTKSDCKVRMYVIYRKSLSFSEITNLELNQNHGIVIPSKMILIQ